jgi:uncharacterized protein YqgC (DUF456 family)
LTQVFILVGLFGLLIPIFPGLAVIWVAVLLYGLVSGFSTLGIVLFIVITILTIVGSLADNVMMGAGARQGGASWLTIGAALLAGVAGTLLLPPLGGIIAAPLAILLLEYRRAGDMDQAWQALKGLATGWGLGVLVRLGVGFLMMLLWWLWVWLG